MARLARGAHARRGVDWRGHVLLSVGFSDHRNPVADKRGRGYFRNFYARRALRIAPLYYGFVLLVLLVIYRLPVALHQASSADWLAALLYGNNFRYAATGTAAPHLGHFWSLAVEGHFYLLWPFAVRFLSRRNLIVLCLAGGVGSQLLRLALLWLGAWPFSVYLLTPCRLDGLLLGSLVALALQEPREWERLRRVAARAISWTGIMLLAIAAGQRQFSAAPRGPDLRLQMAFGLAALAVLFSSLIVRAVDGAGLWPRLLRAGWLREIGRYSYAMYVFHPLITSATKWLVEHNRSRLVAELPCWLGKPVAVVWVAGASFGVAVLSYHLWEKHFLGMQRFFVPTPATSATTLGRSLACGD